MTFLRPHFPQMVALAITAGPAFGAPIDAGGDLFFEQRVRPIFEKRCFECHSHESGKMKGGLTLDSRSGWADGGDSGPAILPGKPDESLLIQAVRRLDDDLAMPPKKALAPEEVAVLIEWVRLGASDPRTAPPKRAEWWALKPLGSPAGKSIDDFISAKLTEKGLHPAPEADRRALLRRVTFDLIGLPPTPDEVAAFLADTAQDGYAKVVDRLLASPRYGERWARHWMDVAHFAETHGNDQDRIRENAWPYRDYLIASFNEDKSYARFVAEQVAGDVLFPEDPQATVALGFLAAGPWDESSLRDIREDTLDRQIARYLDRDDVVQTVMQSFTSTTVQCARCHDHKFDPISQRDYYALQAVFAGVDRANRRYDPDPAVALHRRDLEARRAAVLRGDRALLLAAETQRLATERIQLIDREAKAWRVAQPEVFISTAGATLTRQSDDSLLASGIHGPTDVYTITAPAPLATIAAVRLEALSDESLPQHGPGREPNGNMHLSEFQMLVFEPGLTAPRVVELKNPRADFNQDQWTIAHALDGDVKTAWGIFPKVGVPHAATFELAEKLTVAPGTKLTFILKQLHGGHCIGRPRLSLAEIVPAADTAVLPEETREIAELPDEKRTDAQRATLGAWFLGEALNRELAALPKASLVYAAASEFEPDGGLKPAGRPRVVQVLKRGDIAHPIEPATPGALTCVTALPSRFPDTQDEGERRAALARWLTAPENPLVWRSIVNRVWHDHFGRGLVETPNDFGRMGDAPSHPELLDWLAVWFRDEAHGSLKALHWLIVMSATYRQSVGRTAQPQDFAAFPRLRLDAECVHDAILAISGRLDLRMGGPSDRQFDLQPGIHVTPRVDYVKFDVDSPAGRRRSIYRFLFRTLPDPFMDALDAPAGDQLTPARTNSVTVQQALALWNSPWVTRSSEHFAKRLQSLAPDVDGQVRAAFELAFARPATDAEIRDLAEYGRRHGLAAVCRVLFNSDEFVFLN